MKLRRSIFLAVLLIFVTTFAITYCNHRVDEEEPVETLNPTEDTSAFVNLTDVVPDAILEIRYFSTYNFVGERIRGYEEPTALITREAADSLQAVSQEVMKLPEKIREVIYLYYYEEYNSREIGEILGENVSTIRTRLSRGRTLLKQVLKDSWEA